MRFLIFPLVFFMLRIVFNLVSMMFAKTSLLYSIIRCELCLCCSVWCLAKRRCYYSCSELCSSIKSGSSESSTADGLARVHNKLIMHILPAERKFMRLSSAEVVRNRFRARINEILQQLASQSLDSDSQESVFFLSCCNSV